MTRAELIMEVKGELQVSNALPYSVSDDEINRIINKAKRWFNKYYDGSTEPKYFIIPIAEFNMSEFRKTRFIQMPSCVVSVYNVQETGGTFPTTLISGSMGYTMSLRNPDNVTSIAARQSFYDLTKAFTIKRISFQWNRNTKRVMFKGRDPNNDVLIETEVEIPEDGLFEDYNFIQYVTAQSKISLGKVLGFFDYKLAGGITVNGGDIMSEGKEELEAVKQQINDEQPGNLLVMYNG